MLCFGTKYGVLIGEHINKTILLRSGFYAGGLTDFITPFGIPAEGITLFAAGAGENDFALSCK